MLAGEKQLDLLDCGWSNLHATLCSSMTHTRGARMNDHPELPETPKPTRERKDFFEKLTNPAGQQKPVCRRWDRQHARDMSEAPLHIKLQKFTELQARLTSPLTPCCWLPSSEHPNLLCVPNHTSEDLTGNNHRRAMQGSPNILGQQKCSYSEGLNNSRCALPQSCCCQHQTGILHP